MGFSPNCTHKDLQKVISRTVKYQLYSFIVNMQVVYKIKHFRNPRGHYLTVSSTYCPRVNIAQ